MKALRILLILLLAPVCLFGHDLLASLYEHIATPVRHDMLGFGIAVNFASWAFVLLFPITSWLGELWWKDLERYLFNVFLLIALMVFLSPSWTVHPLRTLLFLACCWAALPARMLVDLISATTRS